MSVYTKTVWKNGDVITSAKLNKIETGIFNISADVNAINVTVTSLNESVNTTNTSIAEANATDRFGTGDGKLVYLYADKVGKISYTDHPEMYPTLTVSTTTK